MVPTTLALAVIIDPLCWGTFEQIPTYKGGIIVHMSGALRRESEVTRTRIGPLGLLLPVSASHLLQQGSAG